MTVASFSERSPLTPECPTTFERRPDNSLLMRTAEPLGDRVLAKIAALGVAANEISEVWCFWDEAVGDLKLLHGLASLRTLIIRNGTKDSLSEIDGLRRLIGLQVVSLARFDANLERWPNLRSLTYSWNGRLSNVGAAPNLVELYVTDWKDDSLNILRDAPQLKRLRIAGGKLRSLNGANSLQMLESLQLQSLRKFDDLTQVGQFRSLRRLIIESCKMIKSLENLRDLVQLEELYLDNLGEIASLKPLEGLRSLRKLSFAESTNILDGDVEVVKSMKLSLAFKNRKHYNYNYNHLTGAETVYPKSSSGIRL